MRNTFFRTAIIAVLFLSTQSFGQSQVIGEYANGCIQDAVQLNDGEHYQVQIWGKGRNYGHPQLIDYIKDLVKKAKDNNLPDLLIGDLSKQNGGPFGKGSAHGSHQSGLDVDISFDFSTPKKTKYELSNPKDVYLVDTKNRITKNFDNKRVALIYLAAHDQRVERIFVAPGIKKVLCDVYTGKDRSWLQKVRPWFGHRGHMHVRLACPLNSPLCVKQAAVPNGDGCGEELMSWLYPKKVTKSTNTTPKTPKRKKVLPEQCKVLLSKK